MARTMLELRVLKYLHDHGTNTVPESVCPDDEQWEVRQTLSAAGLISPESSLSKVLFELTPAGKREAQSASRGLSRRLIQHGILAALAEGGYVTDVAKIRDFDAAVDPIPDPHEVFACATELKEWGLIDGMEADGTLLRPTLTTQGRRALESEYAPEDLIHGEGRATSTHINRSSHHNEFHGPVGSAQIGDHNTASVAQNVGITASDLDRVLSAVRSFAGQHGNAEQQQTVDYHIGTIEQDHESGRGARVTAGVTALANTLITTFGQAAAGGLAQELLSLL